MGGDRWMAHSLLSAPMNLGLLDPLEVVQAAEEAYRRGSAPLASVEGFVRQVDRLARLRLAPLLAPRARTTARRNALGARGAIPEWFAELDPTGTRRRVPVQRADARCASPAGCTTSRG